MFGLNKLDLVQKAKMGNGKAFTKLIEENLNSMYRVAKGILNNEEDIEDIYINHLNSDILKLYKYLTKEWIVYMKYIEKEYPFLYSFALKNIPFKQC